MALEIEKKWLIDLEAVPFDLEAAEKHHITQTYVCFQPQIRLRDIDYGQRFVMPVKADKLAADALARYEFEAEITRDSYEDLSTQLVGKTIAKTRYVVPEPGDTGRKFEIDVFEGEFAGLTVAEMEFASEEDAQSYPLPSWVIEDISREPRYKNIVMAQS